MRKSRFINTREPMPRLRPSPAFWIVAPYVAFAIVWLIHVMARADGSGCPPNSDCWDYTWIMGESLFTPVWFRKLNVGLRGFAVTAFYSFFGPPRPEAFLSAKLVQSALLGTSFVIFALSLARFARTTLARVILAIFVLSTAWQGGYYGTATTLSSDPLGLTFSLFSLSILVWWGAFQDLTSLPGMRFAALRILGAVIAPVFFLFAIKSRESNLALLLPCLPVLYSSILLARTRVGRISTTGFVCGLVGVFLVGAKTMSPKIQQYGMGHVIASIGLSDEIVRRNFKTVPPLDSIQPSLSPMRKGETVESFVSDRDRVYNPIKYGSSSGISWTGDFANPLYRAHPGIATFAMQRGRAAWTTFLVSHPRWFLKAIWDNRNAMFNKSLPNGLFATPSAAFYSVLAAAFLSVAWIIRLFRRKPLDLIRPDFAAAVTLTLGGLVNVIACYWYDIWEMSEMVRHVMAGRIIMSSGCILICVLLAERIIRKPTQR